MAENQFLMYKGRPLVRKGKTLYYGFMNEPYVIIIQIVNTRTVNEVKVADKVIVQLVDTNPDVDITKKIVKRIERHGLYNAIDIATIWLERELGKAQ